jgi:hypothetical protein
MSEKLSGIERAIVEAGSHRALIEILRERANLQISDRAVSYWKKMGYVPTLYAMAFAQATGIPVEDLVNRKPRTKRPNGYASRSGPAVVDQH